MYYIHINAAEQAAREERKIDMITQKEIANFFDRRADGASSKQIWFLAGLMLKAGAAHAESEIEDMRLNSSFRLSSREASSMIEYYLNSQKKAA